MDRNLQNEVFNRIIKRDFDNDILSYVTDILSLMHYFHYSLFEFFVTSWSILSARDVCSKDAEEGKKSACAPAMFNTKIFLSEF